MKKYLALSVALFATVGLTACGNQFKAQLHDSVKANQDAKTLTEWEASDSNPEVLFAKWTKDYMMDAAQREKIQSELCMELLGLDGQSLSVFDTEVRAKDNAPIIAPCKAQVIKLIEDYYSEQREKMAVKVNALSEDPSTNNFQFKTEIEKRDFSNGYWGVTGDVGPKEVILTFDDGPSADYTKSILRSLKEVNAKATFFELAKNVRPNAAITKLVAADGHNIGSHSITHSCLGTSAACQRSNGRIFTFDEAVAEIKGGHQAVYDVLGWVDPMFRFPYGESSPELKDYLKQNSIGEFYWSIDSNDWRAQTNENLLKTTLAALDAKGKGMILFHDIQRKTSEILPQFLQELYTRGYTIVLLQSADSTARYNSKIVTKHVP